MRKNFKNGFTLIEILIVMVIIGILATIVASSFKSAQEKARDTRRKSDLESVAHALELYFNDHGEYPDDDNSGNLVVSDCKSGETCNWDGAFIDVNDTTYMAKVPDEKTSSRNYYYHAEIINGKPMQFALYARLENELDKAIPTDASDNPQYYGGTPSSDCGSGFAGCNYAISSPNVTPEDFFPLALEP